MTQAYSEKIRLLLSGVESKTFGDCCGESVGINFWGLRDRVYRLKGKLSNMGFLVSFVKNGEI